MSAGGPRCPEVGNPLRGLYSQSDGRAVSAAIVVLGEIQQSLATTLRINIVLAVAGVGGAAGAVRRGGHDLSGKRRIEKDWVSHSKRLISG